MDRIFELVDGSYGGRVQRAEAEARFAWMLSKLESGLVLDVGCSQGLLGLRLAEQGIRSVGIDKEPKVIDFALKRREALSNQVQAFASFHCQSLEAYVSSTTEQFSAIVFGQVLEHVDDPAGMLEMVAGRLEAGGRLLITVPYGVWEHDDHHQIFYLKNIADILRTAWHALDIQLVGGRLCLELERRREQNTQWFDEALEYSFFEAKEARHMSVADSWKSRYLKKEKSVLWAEGRLEELQADLEKANLAKTRAQAELQDIKGALLYRPLPHAWRLIAFFKTGGIKRIFQNPFKVGMRRRLAAYEKEMLQKGSLTKAYKARQKLKKYGAKASADMLGSQLQLLDKGYPVTPRRVTPLYTANNKTGLYIAHNSFPFSKAGYAVRTHSIGKALIESGWDMEVVTRLGYPHDRKLVEKHVDVATSELWQGVPYFRFIEKFKGYGAIPQGQYLDAFIERLEQHVLEKKPAVLHAASNYMNGIAANAVARKVGIPSIYEVRGLWELTRISRQPDWEGSEVWELMVRMETQAAQEADHVFALTYPLKKLLIARGVDEKKITVTPNAVDLKRFTPEASPLPLPPEMGIPEDDFLIGYVGSILDYEGVDDLVKAFERLPTDVRNRSRLIIIGDGAFLDEVEELVSDSDASDRISLYGRVPFEEVGQWYARFDVLVYPRKALPVCEIVAPIKIFEAFASARCVVTSSVAVLEDIVTRSGAGEVYDKGNIDHLARVLVSLEGDGERRRRLGQSGLSFVREQANWASVADIIQDVYTDLLSG